MPHQVWMMPVRAQTSINGIKTSTNNNSLASAMYHGNVARSPR